MTLLFVQVTILLYALPHNMAQFYLIATCPYDNMQDSAVPATKFSTADPSTCFTLSRVTSPITTSFSAGHTKSSLGKLLYCLVVEAHLAGSSSVLNHHVLWVLLTKLDSGNTVPVNFVPSSLCLLRVGPSLCLLCFIAHFFLALISPRHT